MNATSLKRLAAVDLSRHSNPQPSRLQDDEVHSRLPDEADPSALASRCQLLMRHPLTGRDELVSIGYSRAVLLLGPIELARRGLKDEGWSRSIREAGRARTMAEHTFDHRVAERERLWA